jgi:hypothetical protein
LSCRWYIRGGLITLAVNNIEPSINSEEYDIIIIGARFAGLIAACELSRRGGKVLMIEARDQISGRSFTTQVDNQQYEIGGTWIHWSQPHIWTEMTRYGFSVIESEGAVANQISSLLDNGSRLKTVSTTDLYSQLFELANKFSDINGDQGRTLFPSPHGPLIKVSNKNLKGNVFVHFANRRKVYVDTLFSSTKYVKVYEE